MKSLIAFSSEVDTGSREENASRQLGAVGAAAAVGAGIPAARAGVQPGLRVVMAASAIGAAVPARAASAGHFDDVGGRRRKRRERHRAGAAAANSMTARKAATRIFFMACSPENTASVRGRERNARAYFADRLVDQAQGALAVSALVRRRGGDFGTPVLQQANAGL